MHCMIKLKAGRFDYRVRVRFGRVGVWFKEWGTFVQQGGNHTMQYNIWVPLTSVLELQSQGQRKAGSGSVLEIRIR